MSSSGTVLSVNQTLNLAGQRDVKAMAYSPSGKYLAVCCVDGLILLYSPSSGDTNPVNALKTHESTVWSVCFAPTEYGTVMASCGSDRAVVIQKENPVTHEWQKLYIDQNNASIVKSVDFTKAPNAPPNAMQAAAMQYLGLHLASACLDGSISVYSLQSDYEWQKLSFPAHAGAANVVKWSQLPLPVNNFGTAPEPGYLLASGGQDGAICIFKFDGKGQYVLEDKLIGHRRPILDLAWMPMNESAEEKIASLADDGSVIVWSKSHKATHWSKQSVHTRVAPAACHLAWNFDGTTVAVSLRDGQPPLLLI